MIAEMRQKLAVMIDQATKQLRAKRSADDPVGDTWLQVRDQLEATDIMLSKIAATAAPLRDLVEVRPESSDPFQFHEEELLDFTCLRVARGEPRIRRMLLHPKQLLNVHKRTGIGWSGHEILFPTPFGDVEIRADVLLREDERRYLA